MSLLSIITLVLKNWPYVVRFTEIIERNIKDGLNQKDLEKGLDRLEKGFKDVKTIKETADSARAINDAFRH
jgi:hypothetical protein